MDAVNKEFKANFHVVHGEGENRLQEEIYEAMVEGETGLMVTRIQRPASRRKTGLESSGGISCGYIRMLSDA